MLYKGSWQRYNRALKRTILFAHTIPISGFYGIGGFLWITSIRGVLQGEYLQG